MKYQDTLLGSCCGFLCLIRNIRQGQAKHQDSQQPASTTAADEGIHDEYCSDVQNATETICAELRAHAGPYEPRYDCRNDRYTYAHKKPKNQFPEKRISL